MPIFKLLFIIKNVKKPLFALLIFLCYNRQVNQDFSDRLAQLVRALRSHRRGRRFKSFNGHHYGRNLVLYKIVKFMSIFKKQIDNNIEKESFLKSAFSFVLELVKIVIVSLAIIIPVRYFLIQPFYVKGASMEPNFLDQEYLIIDEISYRFENPQRGDVVVFRYPGDPRQYFIKRIIGLPGEKVEIKENQVCIYNEKWPEGKVIDESDYLAIGAKTPGNQSVRLKSDEYFILGDNRASSLDSRRFGPIKEDLIIGKAWFRGWPVDRINIFEKPDYNL